MIKNTLLVLIFTLLSSTLAMTQNYVKIKTHNSGQIKGYVLKSIDSAGVNLTMNDYDVRIPFKNIKKISFPRENTLNNRSAFDQNYSYPQFETGFYHSFGIGLLTGQSTPGVNLSIVNGYKVNKYLHGGLGVNFQLYEDISTLPVYMEAKGFVKEGKFIPYYYGHLGYGFLTKHPDRFNTSEYDANGGLYWGAGAGFQVNYFSSALAFSLGYSYQRVDESYSFPDWFGNSTDISQKNMFRRLEFKVALIF